MTRKQYENNAYYNMSTIPNYYYSILDYLLDAEGKEVHYNSTEADITSPGGVYRKKHPEAYIFKYIDAVASEVTDTPSDTWNDSILEQVNSKLDMKVINYYLYIFYNDYLKGAHINYFPIELQLVMVSLYTNTSKGAWKAVQTAIWDLYHLGILEYDKTLISTIDGSYGTKTKNVLKYIKSNLKISDYYVFKMCMINAMKSYYIKLVHGNSDKYLRYLNGWNNRMDALKYLG